MDIFTQKMFTVIDQEIFKNRNFFNGLNDSKYSLNAA